MCEYENQNRGIKFPDIAIVCPSDDGDCYIEAKPHSPRDDGISVEEKRP
jgi:hypothetical protein